MIQVRKLLFLLLVLLSSTTALKGRRYHSRHLEEKAGKEKEEKSDDGKETDSKVQGEKNGDKKEKDDDKKMKEDKKDKEEKKDKKEPKGKKCKNKKDKKEEEDDLEEIDDIEDTTVVCLDVTLDADCTALAAGETPTVPDGADGIAGGTLQVELTSKSDDMFELLNNALDAVALMASGCDVSESQRMLEESTNDTISLNGLTVGDLTSMSSGCATEGTGENCTVLETPFTIYFSGNASDDHLNSMAYSLSDSVIGEAKKGSFEEFVDIYYVSATVDDVQYRGGEIVENEKTTGGGIGGIIGIAVVALALVAGGVAGMLYYKGRKVATVEPQVAKTTDREAEIAPNSEAEHPEDEK